MHGWSRIFPLSMTCICSDEGMTRTVQVVEDSVFCSRPGHKEEANLGTETYSSSEDDQDVLGTNLGRNQEGTPNVHTQTSCILRPPLTDLSKNLTVDGVIVADTKASSPMPCKVSSQLLRLSLPLEGVKARVGSQRVSLAMRKCQIGSQCFSI